MAALDFPTSPTNGQYYQGYVWNDSNKTWDSSYQVDTLKPSMVLIKSQVVGSAVSSVTVTGAFNSTYDNYRIVYTGGTPSASLYLNLQFGSSATAYYAGLTGMNYNNTTSTASDNNATRFTYAGAGSSAPLRASMDVTVLQPYLTMPTIISSSTVSSTAAYTYAGVLSENVSHTQFTMATSAGTITGGTIYVYGMSK